MSTLRNALDFIERAEAATTLEDLQATLRKHLHEYGVSNFSLIAAMPRQDNCARPPVRLSNACAPAWSELYLERKYYNSDAVIHVAINQTAPFTWSDLGPKVLSPTAKRMLDECRDLMCVDGCLVIPTHDAEGFAGLVSLFHEGKEPDAAMRRALKLMAIYASEKAKDLAGIEGEQTGTNGNCPLTPRQREVLAFSALGKTDWEVAQILGISEKTANFHCERAKEQLGVATRAQAIAIAIHRGWVSL